MKVILMQDIYKHGVAGEVVDVADGFARNYLIPRGIAKKATKSELKSHAKLLEQVEARRAQYENKLNEVARQIDGVELFFERRAAVTGKLFGSVTTQEIADALMDETGIDINRRRISQQGLREVGIHEVPVRLGSEISPVLTITIVREGEMADYMAARAQAAEGQVVDPGDFDLNEMQQQAARAEAEEAEADETAEEAPEASVEETEDTSNQTTEVLPRPTVYEEETAADEDSTEEDEPVS